MSTLQLETCSWPLPADSGVDFQAQNGARALGPCEVGGSCLNVHTIVKQPLSQSQRAPASQGVSLRPWKKLERVSFGVCWLKRLEAPLSVLIPSAFTIQDFVHSLKETKLHHRNSYHQFLLLAGTSPGLQTSTSHSRQKGATVCVSAWGCVCE